MIASVVAVVVGDAVVRVACRCCLRMLFDVVVGVVAAGVADAVSAAGIVVVCVWC